MAKSQDSAKDGAAWGDTTSAKDESATASSDALAKEDKATTTYDETTSASVAKTAPGGDDWKEWIRREIELAMGGHSVETRRERNP